MITAYGHSRRYVVIVHRTGRGYCLPHPRKINMANVPPRNARTTEGKALVLMSKRATKLFAYFAKKLATYQQIFVRVTFGAFVGGLVVLLILLYADVPIVGL